jgi:hypothetical protein
MTITQEAITIMVTEVRITEIKAIVLADFNPFL